MHARGLVTDHGFDRVREDHFAFAAPAVDGAAEFFFAHFTFHIICASKENNADNLPRLNHSYYLDRRPKPPAADRGLKSPDRPLQISAARPAGDQFHERSAVRQHQCVGPNDKSSTSERESDGCDGDRQRHHQQVERHADSHEVAESIAADAVNHQLRLSRTAEMSRLARAFDGAAVGHDHRAGRNPRRMHHRHAGERFERGRDGHCRHKSPLSRNENLSRKEARKDSPSRNDALPRSYNLAWKEDLSGHDDLGNRAATEYEATETGSYSECAGVHNEGHLSRRKTKRG